MTTYALGFLGAIIVALVLYDVFESVVVPRWTGGFLRMGPFAIRVLWPFWKWWAQRRDEKKRDDFLAAYASLMLVLLLALWVLLLIVGYGMILYAFRDQIEYEFSFGEACYLAGVALFTIGFGDIVAFGAQGRIVLLMAGASGLAVTALVISLTFTLYGAFSNREALVLTLESRAGAPPSGVSLLETHAQFDLLEDLARLFDRWETWAAQMLDSHLAYPLLPYFRSSHSGLSWVDSLGAVLDAATLLMTTVCAGDKCGERPIGAAHLFYHMGCHTVDDLSVNFFARHAKFDQEDNTNAAPDAGIDRAEFIAARRRLANAGFDLRDANESWESFARHRAVYAQRLDQLAQHFAVPRAQWIGDRATVVYASHHDEHPKMLEIEELHQHNPHREHPYDHETPGENQEERAATLD